MSSQHLSEYPFPELLHRASNFELNTPEQSPVNTPTKAASKQQSPLRAEAPSFIPKHNYQSPSRGQAELKDQPAPQNPFHPQLQPSQNLHHRSKTEPHPRYRPYSSRKYHPRRHPLPPVPRVTLSRLEICQYFGMENMIDDLYKDVVDFLGQRPQGRSEVEAVEFYLEFVAGGGERHKGERTPCRYCEWWGNESSICEMLGMGIVGRSGAGLL